MTQHEEQSGAWIFLSHSNKDFEKVREIRNELEKRGHKPILFYLKCLENDNAMLPDLLRREIAAREWFILRDSPVGQHHDNLRLEGERRSKLCCETESNRSARWFATIFSVQHFDSSSSCWAAAVVFPA